MTVEACVVLSVSVVALLRAALWLAGAEVD